MKNSGYEPIRIDIRCLREDIDSVTATAIIEGASIELKAMGDSELAAREVLGKQIDIVISYLRILSRVNDKWIEKGKTDETR
jgi:hypothetical protein